MLLSCSHVFHRACLDALERHTGQRSCPLCRNEHYQVKLINDGAKAHMHAAAVTIQAAYRGHRVRERLRPLLESHVPNDPKLRAKFHKTRLAKVTDRLLVRAEARRGAVDDFLADLDSDVATVRAKLNRAHARVMARPISEPEWRQIEGVAAARMGAGCDCPICLTPIGTGRGRHRTVLSCSHIFHTQCLESLERFSCGSAGAQPQCPVCRSFYVRRDLDAFAHTVELQRELVAISEMGGL